MPIAPSVPSTISRGLNLLVLVLLGGCAAQAPNVVPPPLAGFYPAPPDLPRIQHLAKFAGVRDLGAPRTELADFVLGDEGKENTLQQPYGAVVFQNKIYVADSRAPGIAVFDLEAKTFSVAGGTGEGRMRRPIHVTIDDDGTQYVADAAREQVLVYDRASRFIAAFGAKGDFRPVDVIVAGDRLYIADIAHHEVHVLDKRSGKRLFKFGGSGNRDDEGVLYQPTNLARAPNGDIYVVETGNFRVSRFTSEGKFVRRFGEPGQSPGQFARPKGIAVDRESRVYVSDAAFENVQIFDRNGNLLMAFGQPSDGSKGLNLPAGISIDYDNVAAFRRYAAPGFDLQYLILVVSQFGPDQVDVFGFGRLRGVSYAPDAERVAKSGS